MSRNITHTLAVKLVQAYKLVVSPWLPPACRFTPTCSEYAVEAIEQYGLLGGVIRAIGRQDDARSKTAEAIDAVVLPHVARARTRQIGNDDHLWLRHDLRQRGPFGLLLLLDIEADRPYAKGPRLCFRLQDN